MDESKAKLPHQSRSDSSPPDLKALSLSVFFNGWRKANPAFKSWAIKMSSLHKPTWKKAGIFEAVMASTTNISKDSGLVVGIAEKWCPDTNTFVFPWGEATITLEDVMLLLGFSVLGSPVFAILDSSGEKILGKLEKQWLKFKKDKVKYVTKLLWMERFMGSGDDKLEHVAFLVLWLSYFVFPTRYYHVDKSVFPIAVHLSRGNRIALAPAVLAHLYAELTLLKHHIRGFNMRGFTDKVELSSLFKLVQVWTWERFKELRPQNPNPLLKGQPSLALWCDLKGERARRNVRKILANSSMDGFEWRPYTKALRNWKFPQFYSEEAMYLPVDQNLDDEVISFARCIKVSELVGINSVEHYFPNRVASQFGLLQDAPCSVNRNNLSKEAAWDEYNKPIDDEMTLYIPSRSAITCFTSMYCKWWRKDYRAAESLTPRNIIGDDISEPVPCGSKKRKSMKRVCKVPSEKDDEDDSLTIAQVMKLRKKNTAAMCSSDENHSLHPPKVLPLREVLQKLGKEFPEKLKRSRYLRTPTNVRSEIVDSGGSASREVPLNQLLQKEVGQRKSEHLGDKPAREDDDDDESCMDCYDNITTAEMMIIDREKSVGVASESLDKRNMVLSSANGNNSSDPPLGANGEVVDIVVSRPKTRQKCDDEVGVYGNKAEKKKTIVAGGTKEVKCLLHKEGDNQRSNEKEDVDESLNHRDLATDELALNLEARMMVVEKTLAKIREWKTIERNHAKNGMSA